MPTVLRVGPYSFVFFSSDRGEPPHIHVQQDRRIAKLWLENMALAKNRGFKQHELGRIKSLVEENRELLLRAWHDFFAA